LLDHHVFKLVCFEQKVKELKEEEALEWRLLSEDKEDVEETNKLKG
jgi:hypothetical protein